MRKEEKMPNESTANTSDLLSTNNAQDPETSEARMTYLLEAYQKARKNSFINSVLFSVLAFSSAILLYLIIISNSLNVVKSIEIYPLVYSDIMDTAFKNKLVRINADNALIFKKSISEYSNFFKKETEKINDIDKSLYNIIRILNDHNNEYSFRLLNPDGTYQNPQNIAHFSMQVANNASPNRLEKGDYLRINIGVNFIEYEPTDNSIKVKSKQIIDDYIKISISDPREWGVDIDRMNDNSFYGVPDDQAEKYFSSKKSGDLIQIKTIMINHLEEMSRKADNLYSVVQSDSKGINSNFEKRIDQISAGNVAYVFDVIKRAVILLMFVTFSLIFLRMVIVELTFSNNISRNYLNFLMFEASSKSANDQIAFKSVIADKSSCNPTSVDDVDITACSFLSVLFELLNKIKGK
jgi:hypothetical protein